MTYREQINEHSETRSDGILVGRRNYRPTRRPIDMLHLLLNSFSRLDQVRLPDCLRRTRTFAKIWPGIFLVQDEWILFGSGLQRGNYRETIQVSISNRSSRLPLEQTRIAQLATGTWIHLGLRHTPDPACPPMCATAPIRSSVR